MSSFSMELDEDLLAADLDARAEVAEAATRPAAQAIAQVLVEAVRSNVSRIKKKTGKLSEAIYQAYSRDNSTETLATYHVSWNARKAPHGHLIENGYLQIYEMVYDERTERFYTRKDRPLAAPRHIAAQPFVRPAQAEIPRAQQAGVDRFNELLRQSGLFQ